MAASSWKRREWFFIDRVIGSLEARSHGVVLCCRACKSSTVPKEGAGQFFSSEKKIGIFDSFIGVGERS
jgi:hypothetical protein